MRTRSGCELARLDRAPPCACWTMRSTCRAFRCRRSAQEAIAKRRIGLGVTGLADALIFCRTRYGSPESVALIERWLSDPQPCRLSRLRRTGAGKRRLPAVRRATNISRGRISRRCRDDIRDAHRRARHPQRAAHLHRAHRHHLAVRRTMSPAASSRSSPSAIPAKCCSPTAARARRRSRIMPCRAFRARFGADAPLPDYFVNAQTLVARTIIWRCRRRRSRSSTARSPRPSMCRPRSPSRRSRMSISPAYEIGCKGCTTYRPNAVTGAVLSVEEPTRRAAGRSGDRPGRRRAGIAAALARAASRAATSSI